MRAYVAEASGGQDKLELNKEKPLTLEDQQALSLAAEMVSADAQTTFQSAQPMIQELAQKVQQAQKAKLEQAMNSDPAASALMKTQMAETQRKAQEFQTKMQTEVQRMQQEYQLKVAELQQKVQELMAKYQTQSDIDSQKNSTNIALANINNASRERIASISKGMEMDALQAQLEHEQTMSAIDAINTADDDIRKHGIAIEQQAFQQQAQAVQQALDAENQARLQAQQAATKPPQPGAI